MATHSPAESRRRAGGRVIPARALLARAEAGVPVGQPGQAQACDPVGLQHRMVSDVVQPDAHAALGFAPTLQVQFFRKAL